MKTNVTIDELRQRTLSRVGMKKQAPVGLPTAYIDSATRENQILLDECRQWWDGMRDVRNRYMRAFNYYRGKQWSDMINDPDRPGRFISEEDYLMRQGKVPLKQNRIRTLVANLIGQYRSNPTEAVVTARGRENASLGEMLTNTLQCALENQEVEDLDPRALEAFLMSGVACQKIGFDYIKERNMEDLVIENVNLNRLFMNTDVTDVRGKDLRIIGEIVDTTIDDIVASFARNRAQEKAIRDLYSGFTSKEIYVHYGFDSRQLESLDFYIPREPGVARLFIVWQVKNEWRTRVHDPLDGTYKVVKYSLADIARMNDERLALALENGMNRDDVALIEAESRIEQVWYVKYLTPSGHCLYEGESPYDHEEHPYSFVLFPLLNGEVWGFVEDIIDQQRYINRMIILLDFIIGASAKGVLMAPEDCVPDEMTPEEFADEYRRFNGVIFYKPRPDGQVPRQISSNSSNVGIMEMINLQMSLLEKNSGINESIQGQRAPSGTPAALYAQEAQNATLNVIDQLKSFQSMILRRNRKALKVITQFYKDKRYLAINGPSVTDEERIYDPDLARSIDWDMSISSGTDTPVYRQAVDNMLFELLKGGLIPLEMYLKHTSMPFADKLLSDLHAQAESVGQGGAPSRLSPEMIAQVSQGTNPQATALLQQAMGLGNRQNARFQ